MVLIDLALDYARPRIAAYRAADQLLRRRPRRCRLQALLASPVPEACDLPAWR